MEHCHCPCHPRDVYNHVDAPLDQSDEASVAAVFACDSCRYRHSIVFAPVPKKPKRKSTWVDKPRQEEQDAG